MDQTVLGAIRACMTDGVVLVDPDNKIDFANEHA